MIKRALIGGILGIALLLGDSGTSRRNPRFQKQYTQKAVVPNSLTDLTTTDTMLHQILVANTTGSAVTFTLQDKAGTPIKRFAAVSIAANTTLMLVCPEGCFFEAGLSWQAGTADALHGEVLAWQK